MSASRVFLKIINHLLAQSGSARARLASHADRHVQIDLTPFRINFSITKEGFIAASTESEPEVPVSILLSDALANAGDGPQALMNKARINGAADLTDTLADVFLHLNWDAEEDISRLVGDIAAHRIVQTGEKFVGLTEKLAHRVRERLSLNETAPVVSKPQLAAFSADIQTLNATLDTLEKRLNNKLPE